MATIRSSVPVLAFVLLAASTALGQCPCDCNDDGKVVVPELVRSVNVVLERSPCPPAQTSLFAQRATSALRESSRRSPAC